MTDKKTTYGITKHRHEGYMYFATSHAEHQQYLEMALGDIKPEYCSWRIQPLKHDPKGYHPKIISSGGVTYIVTSAQEMEYAIGSGWGGKDDENFRFTIPPYRHTSS